VGRRVGLSWYEPWLVRMALRLARGFGKGQAAGQTGQGAPFGGDRSEFSSWANGSGPPPALLLPFKYERTQERTRHRLSPSWMARETLGSVGSGNWPTL
jgi:hypothetical protein